MEKEEVQPWLPIPNCSRNVLITRNGSGYVARRGGVAQFQTGRLTFVGGGFTGNVSLFEGIDGAPWAFSNGDPDGSPAVLVRLGERLGNQERFTLDYAPAHGVNAAQIDPDRFLIIGNAGIVITELYPAATEVITRDLTNPMGLARLSSERFIVTSDCAKPISPTQAKSMVCLSEINTASRTVTRLAQLNLTGSGSELAAGVGTAAYLYSHFSSQGIVVQFQTLPVMNRTY